MTMERAIVEKQDGISTLENVVIQGDLAKLTAPERVNYYRTVCESLGLNPYTKPFEYITLNNKLTLYAKRDAADQLRNLHGVSVQKPDIQYVDDLIIVSVSAVNAQGRSDSDLGVVSLGTLRGEGKANAIMKAVTKAKRRVTLSLCGLGWLDETEVDSIPDARPVKVDTQTGEILDETPPQSRQDAQETASAPKAVSEANAGNPASEKQLALIKKLSKSSAWDGVPEQRAEFCAEVVGRQWTFDDLTKAEASTLIEALMAADATYHAEQDEAAQAKADDQAGDDPFENE